VTARVEQINSPQTTEDNIRLAMAGLTSAWRTLFFDAKSATDARKDPRIRELELAICDAIKIARPGENLPILDVRRLNRELNAGRRMAVRADKAILRRAKSYAEA
jgi:hypothetical protein